MSFQGVAFTSDMRQMIVNVKHFFDDSKNNKYFQGVPASTLTAKALGISISTVKVVMAAYNKEGEKALKTNKTYQRSPRAYDNASGMEALIRQYIRQANKEGSQVNVEIIRRFMRDDLKCDIAHTTLWRALQRWGFECGSGVRSAKLKESERIIILRRQYLRQKRDNRDKKGNIIRPEIYLDESYINKNHSNDITWYFEDDDRSIGKPTGKGERLIIVNAISKNGWVPIVN